MKIRKTFLGLLVSCLVFVFASCKEHTHEYSEEWKHDADKHWVEATCCEGEIGLEAAHTFNQGEITTQPGCETKGVKTYTCTVCKFTKTEEIAATGHKGGEADCENKAVCSSCNKEYGELGGHSFGEWVAEVPATCAVAGTKGHYVCSICEKNFANDKATEITDLVIPATGNHNYTALKYDADSHWYECGCGAVKPESDVAHSGGTATCEAKAICSVCEQAYGELATEHPYETEWSTSDTKHWHQADCSHDLKKDEADHTLVTKYDATHHWSECSVCGYTSTKVAHSGGEADCENKAVCSTCEQVYGELGGHSFGEWVAEVPATCAENGTKGHYVCGVCEKNFDSDKTTEITDLVILATGDHNYAVVKYSADSHWYECGCGAVKPESEELHRGGTATCEAKAECEVCEQPYGELATEHKYSTEWTKTETHHYHAAACSHDVKADEGEHSMVVKYEGEQHWTECETCGYATEPVAHSGGTATCTEKAVCTTCGQPHGEPLGHTFGEWNKEIPAKCNEAGTKGYQYCSECKKNFAEDGVNEITDLVIPATGQHEYTVLDKDDTNHWYECVCGEVDEDTVLAHELETKYDETNHWTECACGYATNPVAHDGGEATCRAKAVCTTCNQSYGELAPHTVNKDEWIPEVVKCEEEGTKGHYVCTVCSKNLDAEKNEITDLVLEAAGHSYGEATYVWSTNLSTCTAKAVCTRDESHVVEETVTVSTIEVEVTTTKAVYTYNVVFANNLFEAQAEEVEETVEATEGMVTIKAPKITDRVASHDYVIVDCKAENAKKTITIYYSEVDVWDKTTVSKSLSGAGTEDDPYLIQSGADLAYFKSLVDGGDVYNTTTGVNFADIYFKLTKSIDLNGEDFMMGYYAAWNNFVAFSGIFDGNNCSIRGLATVDAGKGAALFGSIYSGGIVKNLSVYGTLTGNSMGAGGVAVYVKDASLENCTNYATVTGIKFVGGVVSNSENSGSGHLINCVNYGTISGISKNDGTSTFVGGVAGSTGTTINGCYNYGSITLSGEVLSTAENLTANKTITVYAGGLFGNTKNKVVITNSCNYGPVTNEIAALSVKKSTDTSIKLTVSVGTGGIAGVLLVGADTSKGLVENCKNYGLVTGKERTAGIIGQSTGNISNCENNGKIISSGYQSAGIVGNADKGTISNCFNNANIESTADYIAGIAGRCCGTISNCINNGKVTGNNYVAGIVGSNNTGTVAGCTNNGEVTGNENVGGLVATNFAATSVVTNSTNNGKVTGTTNVGGLVAINYKAGATAQNCTNTADVYVTTASGVGSGTTASDAGTTTGCTSTGEVINTAS